MSGSNRTGISRRKDGGCYYCLKPLTHPTNKFCDQRCITSWTNKRRTTSNEERFWAKVNKTRSCWVWLGKPRGFGYGRIELLGGQTQSTHRYSWELHNGPIPTGMAVLHKCDVPQCVNPDHLFLGTQLENMRDRRSKGR